MVILHLQMDRQRHLRHYNLGKVSAVGCLISLVTAGSVSVSWTELDMATPTPPPVLNDVTSGLMPPCRYRLVKIRLDPAPVWNIANPLRTNLCVVELGTKLYLC